MLTTLVVYKKMLLLLGSRTAFESPLSNSGFVSRVPPEKRDARERDERRARTKNGDVRARRAAPNDPARVFQFLAGAFGSPPFRASRVLSETHARS